MEGVKVSNINPELATKWGERLTHSLHDGACIICGKLNTAGHRLWTCSEECHQKFKDEMTADFGEYKLITDATTDKIYRVPTEVIFEKGIRQQDLKNYPVVK